MQQIKQYLETKDNCLLSYDEQSQFNRKFIKFKLNGRIFLIDEINGNFNIHIGVNDIYGNVNSWTAICENIKKEDNIIKLIQALLNLK